MLNNSMKIAINQECGLKPYGTHIYLDGQEVHNVVGMLHLMLKLKGWLGLGELI